MKIFLGSSFLGWWVTCSSTSNVGVSNYKEGGENPSNKLLGHCQDGDRVI